MIRPLSLFIGLRYTRAKRRNQFISFISLASILGIALGVMVLITVLSVMNGFDEQIRARFFAIAPQVTALTTENMSQSWPKLRHQVMQIPEIAAAAPFVNGKGMLIVGSQVSGLDVIGIDVREERAVSQLAQSMVDGDVASLKPNSFNIIVGRDLAQSMNIKVGDKVNVFTPQTLVTLVGVLPRMKRFTVAGIFHTSSGFGFDMAVAYINMDDAQRLFPPGQGTRGLHIKLHDIYDADYVSRELQRMLPPSFQISNWMLMSGAFFQALVMEKTMLFVILLLIVAVAAFNLVSTLVMVVNDKRADIAILRTLGASPGTIMRTILVTGSVIGLIGTLLGLMGGLLLASHVTALTESLQRLLGVRLLSDAVFFVDYVPSLIKIGDVVSVCLIALGLSVLATLYPAWIAFRTQPAEALRYE